MRPWALLTVTCLALAAPARAQQVIVEGLSETELRREMARVQAAHQADAPLDSAARFRRLDEAALRALLSGQRWRFVVMHLEAQMDFMADGRLKMTSLANPVLGTPDAVRDGSWRVQDGLLCLSFGEKGECVVGYGLGPLILLGAVDAASPAGRQRSVIGALAYPVPITAP